MAAESHKFVYAFGGGSAEGRADMKALLGGKGANLAEMANLGLPVPPGFTITTEVCTVFSATGGTYPEGLAAQVDVALAAVGSLVGKRFGDAANPLLVSIRSGARASMPGMMDTVLNLGLNDRTVEGLAARSGDRRFAFDSYRRFISMYSDVVLGVDHADFEEILGGFKDERGYALDTEITATEWEGLIARYKGLVEEATGQALPAGCGRAAVGRHRRGVQVLGRGAGGDLSQAQCHSAGLGHGGQCPGHGLRQHGRDQRHRRGLHPQSLDRHARALWRVPGERPGRGRGGRHPHAAEHHRTGAHRGQFGCALAGSADAGGLRRAARPFRPARAALPRHAGHGVHHPGGQALDAADAHRQAHRQGGAEDCRRHGGGGADLQGRRGAPHRSIVA